MVSMRMKVLSNFVLCLVVWIFSYNVLAEPVINYLVVYGEQLREKADSGDDKAQYDIAWNYYRGTSPFSRDYRKAYEYWLKAASNNHAPSANMLGGMYEDGKGVKKNDTKAVVCYTHSATLKNFEGSVNLARKYWNGEGIVQDHTVAYALNVVAAPQNNAKAYYTQISRATLEKWLTPREIEDAKKLAKDLAKSTNYFITIEEYLNAHGKVGFSKPLLAFKLD